jgi:hypothetical protein
MDVLLFSSLNAEAMRQLRALRPAVIVLDFPASTIRPGVLRELDALSTIVYIAMHEPTTAQAELAASLQRAYIFATEPGLQAEWSVLIDRRRIVDATAPLLRNGIVAFAGLPNVRNAATGRGMNPIIRSILAGTNDRGFLLSLPSGSRVEGLMMEALADELAHALDLYSVTGYDFGSFGVTMAPFATYVYSATGYSAFWELMLQAHKHPNGVSVQFTRLDRPLECMICRLKHAFTAPFARLQIEGWEEDVSDVAKTLPVDWRDWHTDPGRGVRRLTQLVAALTFAA